MPASMTDFIVSRFGLQGRTWVEKQRGVLADCAEQWDLGFDGLAPGGLPTNVVIFVRRAGKALVLKTGFPHPEHLNELFTELQVLRRWQGRAQCVQLVDYDEAHGVLLMERVLPGTMFRQESVDQRSTSIPDLFSLTPLEAETLDGDLPNYRDWIARAFETYRKSGETLLLPHLILAEAYLAKLLNLYPDQYLLHGDLHHENMLKGDDDAWIAIDPKGVMGPPILEYGRFMHNFVADETQHDSVEAVLVNRSKTLAGKFPVDELLMTGYIDLVLSVCWTLNDDQALCADRCALLENYRKLVT